MKWSVPPFRMVAPLLVLALSACSNPSTAPLLVDSELGQPLADTRRSGETVQDRQSEPAPKPPVQHRVTNRTKEPQHLHGKGKARTSSQAHSVVMSTAPTL